jgi:hypothetical protein
MLILEYDEPIIVKDTVIGITTSQLSDTGNLRTIMKISKLPIIEKVSQSFTEQEVKEFIIGKLISKIFNMFDMCEMFDNMLIRNDQFNQDRFITQVNKGQQYADIFFTINSSEENVDILEILNRMAPLLNQDDNINKNILFYESIQHLFRDYEQDGVMNFNIQVDNIKRC